MRCARQFLPFVPGHDIQLSQRREVHREPGAKRWLGPPQAGSEPLKGCKRMGGQEREAAVEDKAYPPAGRLGIAGAETVACDTGDLLVTLTIIRGCRNAALLAPLDNPVPFAHAGLARITCGEMGRQWHAKTVSAGAFYLGRLRGLHVACHIGHPGPSTLRAAERGPLLCIHGHRTW